MLGTSRRRRNEADGLVPPATLRAGGGCGTICASLVVNDVITSPPPRSSISPRKLHQRGPLWISSQPLSTPFAKFEFRERERQSAGCEAARRRRCRDIAEERQRSRRRSAAARSVFEFSEWSTKEGRTPRPPASEAR